MKRALITLFAIASTVACAEREKEAPAPPPPTTQATAAATDMPKPHGLVVKRPLNMAKVENVGAPNLPTASASASVSAAPSTK